MPFALMTDPSLDVDIKVTFIDGTTKKDVGTLTGKGTAGADRIRTEGQRVIQVVSLVLSSKIVYALSGEVGTQPLNII